MNHRHNIYIYIYIYIYTKKKKKKEKKKKLFFFFSFLLFVRPFLELPDLQTFFCPFSVLRIFRFLALPEIAHFRFEISGNRFSARARAENLVPKMF